MNYFVNGGTMAMGNFIGFFKELLINIGRVLYNFDEYGNGGFVKYDTGNVFVV